MPQPELEFEQPLIEAYRTAWQKIQEEQERLVTNPLAYRRKLRLVEMRKSIEADMDGLDKEAAQWLSKQFPKAYASGMLSTPAATSPLWTMIHQEAVEELSVQLFKELLQATDGVRDSAKTLVRTIARDAALQKAIVGKTANQAASEMRRVLESKGIHSITYSNGTKHGLAEYTQVAIRTTTAKAYNRGTLGAHEDVAFFEIFDGPNCGLSTHSDPRLALGLVVDRSTAEANLISHPNCRRSFGPRPDVKTAQSAQNASPTTTPEQRRVQLEQDAAAGDRGAARELQRPSREDVFTKRQARLDAQREKYRESDRASAQRAKEKKLAERQAKLDEVAAARAAEEAAKAAEEAAKAAAASDPFPEWAKLDAPQSYFEAATKANPGTGDSYRNNCHFVAPTMEMRARGYDVVASQTFQRNGRAMQSMELDWIDPATGKSRLFGQVRVNALVSNAERFDLSLEKLTEDWPPGARGFMVNQWNSGGAHVWNVYKDSKGVLRHVDGQVGRVNAKSYIGESSSLRIMRVDDLEPVRDRVAQVATTAKEPVDKANQLRVGRRMFKQLRQDYQTVGGSGFYMQISIFEQALLKLGLRPEDLYPPMSGP